MVWMYVDWYFPVLIGFTRYRRNAVSVNIIETEYFANYFEHLKGKKNLGIKIVRDFFMYLRRNIMNGKFPNFVPYFFDHITFTNVTTLS